MQFAESLFLSAVILWLLGMMVPSIATINWSNRVLLFVTGLVIAFLGLAWFFFPFSTWIQHWGDICFFRNLGINFSQSEKENAYRNIGNSSPEQKVNRKIIVWNHSDCATALVLAERGTLWRRRFRIATGIALTSLRWQRLWLMGKQLRYISASSRRRMPQIKRFPPRYMKVLDWHQLEAANIQRYNH